MILAANSEFRNFSLPESGDIFLKPCNKKNRAESPYLTHCQINPCQCEEQVGNSAQQALVNEIPKLQKWNTKTGCKGIAEVWDSIRLRLLVLLINNQKSAKLTFVCHCCDCCFVCFRVLRIFNLRLLDFWKFALRKMDEKTGVRQSFSFKISVKPSLS